MPVARGYRAPLNGGFAASQGSRRTAVEGRLHAVVEVRFRASCREVYLVLKPHQGVWGLRWLWSGGRERVCRGRVRPPPIWNCPAGCLTVLRPLARWRWLRSKAGVVLPRLESRLFVGVVALQCECSRELGGQVLAQLHQLVSELVQPFIAGHRGSIQPRLRCRRRASAQDGHDCCGNSGDRCQQRHDHEPVLSPRSARLNALDGVARLVKGRMLGRAPRCGRRGRKG